VLIGSGQGRRRFSEITGSGEVVVDIRSGWDYSHTELANALWTNPNPNKRPGFPDDIHGGTSSPTPTIRRMFTNASTNPMPGMAARRRASSARACIRIPATATLIRGSPRGEDYPAEDLPMRGILHGGAEARVSTRMSERPSIMLCRMVEDHPSYNIVAVNLSLEVPARQRLRHVRAIRHLHPARPGIYISAATGE